MAENGRIWRLDGAYGSVALQVMRVKILYRVGKYLPLSWQLRLLLAAQRHFEKSYDQQYKKRRAEHASREELQTVASDAHWADLELDDEILRLQTDYLLSLTARYVLPYPNSEDWEDARVLERRRLSREAIAKLRSAIRQEQKERREGMLAWIPIITASTGFLGVVVAIIALLTRKP